MSNVPRVRSCVYQPRYVVSRAGHVERVFDAQAQASVCTRVFLSTKNSSNILYNQLMKCLSVVRQRVDLQNLRFNYNIVMYMFCVEACITIDSPKGKWLMSGVYNVGINADRLRISVIRRLLNRMYNR